MSTQPKFNVSICGAGVGGLALAVTLGKFSDLSIDLYEAGAEITTAGAGVLTLQRTWQIMQRLGLDEALSEKAVQRPKGAPAPVWTYRRADQEEEGQDMFAQEQPQDTKTLHRADLVQIFRQSLPKSCTLHTLKKLSHYEREDSSKSLILHFADGTTAKAEVLIGADGVNSVTRKTMFETLAKERNDETLLKYGPAIWTGTYVYRALVPVEHLDRRVPNHFFATKGLSWCGKGKTFVTYPISQGRIINAAAMITDLSGKGKVFVGKAVTEVSEEEVKGTLKNWEPAIQALTECMKNPSRWAIVITHTLPFSVSDHVALIGDAAHAMRPQLAAGAGQSIEDAYILGKLLSHPSTTLSNLEQVLKIYQDIRLPFAQNVAEYSNQLSKVTEFRLPEVYDGGRGEGEREGVARMKQYVNDRWAWQFMPTGGPDQDWEDAQVKLQDLCKPNGGD